MSQKDWTWMPHAGHFILSHLCRFRMNTHVNGYIISTVGEYLPETDVMKILGESRGVDLSGLKGDAIAARWMEVVGYDEIGYGRKYETLVFPAEAREGECCPFRAASWLEIDSDAYNDAEDAYAGHLAMCEKYDTGGAA